MDFAFLQLLNPANSGVLLVVIAYRVSTQVPAGGTGPFCTFTKNGAAPIAGALDRTADSFFVTDLRLASVPALKLYGGGKAVEGVQVHRPMFPAQSMNIVTNVPVSPLLQYLAIPPGESFTAWNHAAAQWIRFDVFAALEVPL